MIGLPRSTYYRRAATSPIGRGAAPTAAAERLDRDASLRDAITAVRRTFPAYGYRRVACALRRDGLVVNKKSVQRVMRGLIAPPLPRRAAWAAATGADPDVITGA